MKSLITATMLSAALLTSAISMAEEPKQCDKRHERLFDKLELTEDREQAVREVMTQYHEARKAIMEQTHEQMEALHEQQNTAMSELLTEEEMAIVTEAFEKRMKHKKHFREPSR